MLSTILFVFIVHVLYIGNASESLRVENNLTSFRVFVNELEVFYHSNSAPMFYTSKTEINFLEHHGNFRINESIEAGPVFMNSFSLVEGTDENDAFVWTATLSNSEESGGGFVSCLYFLI